MQNPTTPTPTASDNVPCTAPPLYISPVLQGMEPGLRPQPSPACETCPASQWFMTQQELKCFCTRMHLIVWDTSTPHPILACDGRELAIAAILEAANAE